MISYNSKKNIAIENVKIIWRNFSGETSRYNKDGKRTFNIVLTDPADVELLRRDGWKIKELQRDEDEEEAWTMQVSVNYGRITPMVHMINSQGKKRLLNEDTIDLLDGVEIANVDLIIRPYEWDVNGETGTKAYVKSMYVTIEEDQFASKYADEDEEEPFH